MKTIKIIITLFTLSLISCTENSGELDSIDETEQSIASFEDYFNFLQQDNTGELFVQSYTTNNSDNSIYDLASSIEGDKAPLNLDINGKSYVFSKHQYSKNQNRSHSSIYEENLSNLFGKTFNLDYQNTKLKATSNKSASSSTSASNDGVYIPEIIDADFVNLINGKISAGTKVSWNADGLNVNGIVVGIEYKPYSQTNTTIRQKFPNQLMIGSTLPDSGSYIFTSEDLKIFPPNSRLSFYVGRAGFGITTDSSGNDYSLSGLTVSRADFEIMK